MLIEHILSKTPADAFVHLQRRVNDRLPFDEGCDVPREFRPDGPIDQFAVPYTYLAEDESVTVFESQPDMRLRAEVRANERIKFAIHPLLTARHASLRIDGEQLVTPLASIRSLLVVTEDGWPYIIKVDLPRKVAGFTRHMRQPALEHVHLIMRTLRTAALPDYLAIMPEPVAVSYRTLDSAGMLRETGVVYREFDAWPAVPGRRWLVPVFSLYSFGEDKRGSSWIFVGRASFAAFFATLRG